jgi:hypothetical protein
VQGHDLAVDAGADTAVTDLGVDLVGEVQRRGPGGERLDFALGREHVDLLLEEVGAQRLHELAGVRELGVLPVEHRAQPLQLGVLAERGALLGAIRAEPRLELVDPVGGDPELGHLVHLVGADLDLQGPALGTDHGRVQRLVHVELASR